MHSAVIAASFQFSRYSTIEGQPVTVCASIVSGTSDIALTLSLGTAPGTAEG